MTEYSITQVAKMLEIPQHVLRMWESQFSNIQPVRGKNGRRAYNDETIDAIREAQVLLHEKGMTMAEARMQLNSDSSALLTTNPHVKIEQDAVRSQLQAVLRALENASAALAKS